MAKLIHAGAVQADADLCNIVDPPVSGVHAGHGVHVVIPGDYAVRIIAGQQVPGCSYYSLQFGELTVSDRAVALLSTPSVVNAMTPAQQAQASALNAKLASAVVIP